MDRIEKTCYKSIRAMTQMFYSLWTCMLSSVDPPANISSIASKQFVSIGIRQFEKITLNTHRWGSGV